MNSDNDYINDDHIINLPVKKSKKNDKPSEKVAIIFLQSTNELKSDNFGGVCTDSDSECGSSCSSDNDDNFNRKTSIKKILKSPKKTPLSKKFKINKGNPITDLQSLINSLEHPKATKFQKEFVEVLKELNSMIGMTKFKEQLINQLLFFIQDYKEPGMFLHTVLLGSPGTGKTTVCKILGKIYSKLGILQTDKVVVADRSSLIAKYLGQTAIKTKEVLKSAKGGVLLLDEVYSLGNKDGGDSFSKECIDTINQYLSEHAEDLICVIAGYKEQVQECFFNHNPGLERRFPWKFVIDDYNESELCNIFKTQVNTGWDIDIEDAHIIDKIKNNKELFKGNGGDTKNLLDKCKMAHARRTFTESESSPNKKRKLDVQNKILNKYDFDTGFKYFTEGRNNKKDTSYVNHMYI